MKRPKNVQLVQTFGDGIDFPILTGFVLIFILEIILFLNLINL